MVLDDIYGQDSYIRNQYLISSSRSIRNSNPLPFSEKKIRERWDSPIICKTRQGFLLHSTLTHYVTIQVAMKSSYDTISIVLAKVGVGLFKKLVTHLISRFYVDLYQV